MTLMKSSTKQDNAVKKATRKQPLVLLFFRVQQQSPFLRKMYRLALLSLTVIDVFGITAVVVNGTKISSENV